MPGGGVQLGFLKYVLGFDSLLFRKGLTDAEADLAKLQKSFQRTGASLAKIGGAMSIGLTAPLVAFGKASFQAASDAAELDSAFGTTFGRMAGAMSAWAEATGDAMGRSTQEIKKAANTFGIFFNTAVDPAKAAQMSRTFAVLAQDLASFFNVDAETALEKLRAGLAGEAEPLRAFGVFLSEAAVKAKAYQLGIAELGEELTEQQKIQARAAIILEQTAKAQGDVARTSGSTANQLRSAQAAWQELQVVVGTQLLPVLTPLISRIADLLDWFVKLPAPVRETAVTLAAVSAAAGPVLIALGALINVAGKSAVLGQFAAGLAGIGVASGTAATGAARLGIALRGLIASINPVIAVVAAVLIAFENWDKIKPIVQRMVEGVAAHLRNNLTRELEAVKARIQSVADKFRWLYDVVVGHSYVPDMVSGIAAEMGRLDAVMVAPANAATQKTADAFEVMSDRALSPFEQWAQSIPQSAAQIRDAFQGIAVQGLDGLADAIADVIEGTSSLKEAFGDLAKSVISDLIRMTIRMLLFRAISGIFGGGVTPGGPASVNVGGGTDAFFSGNPFGGFRASGGPVVPGRTYVVGENGPEFLNVGRRGFVTPPSGGRAQPQRVVIELRDQMLEARIAQGASVQIMRAHGALRADTLRAQAERSRRAAR